MCEDVIDNSIHEDALASKGFSIDEINDIIGAEKKRNQKAFEKMAKMLIDPDSITEDMPPSLCSDSGTGLVPTNPAALQHSTDVVLDTMII